MADEKALERLERIRVLLVGWRREQSEFVDTYDAETAMNPIHLKEVISAQRAIEEIDKAIGDERAQIRKEERLDGRPRRR